MYRRTGFKLWGKYGIGGSDGVMYTAAGSGRGA